MRDVRKAILSDAPDIGRLHVLCWQVAYRGLMPDEFLNNLNVEKSIKKWREFTQDPNKTAHVIDDDQGRVAGFSILVACRDTDAEPFTAEVGAIYVHPDKWRSGFGRALLAKSIDQARQSGFHEITLWVLEANLKARCFYESIGFKLDGVGKTVDRAEGFTIDEVRYRLRLPEAT
jgi:L-amino acid N-acyltransferase YncA